MSIFPSRQSSREDWVCRIFDTRQPLMAHVMGIPYRVEIENSSIPERVDHVMMELQVPPCGPVTIAVNTLSRLNRLAGFDPRLRVAMLRSIWTEKPEPFLDEFPGLDYAEIEAKQPLEYHYYEHEPLAEMLVAKGRAALRVEAWGQLYRRNYLGMHQIHSRRASCAVHQDIVGKDGALRLYLPDGTTEMYLFKYCGQ